MPVPEPAATRIDGLRMALDDPTIDGLGPHITLVPPVNVRDDALEAAFALLWGQAGTPPVVTGIGPIRTFSPANPVLYAAVAEAASLGFLRHAMFQPPLSRPLSHSFVPHITLNPRASDAQIEHLPNVTRFADMTTLDRVELLEEVIDDDGRRWRPYADVVLGSEAVAGRGGLETRLITSTYVPPWLTARLPHGTTGDLVISAIRMGEVVGAHVGQMDGSRWVIESFWVAEPHRATGVGSALLRRLGELSADAQRSLVVGDRNDDVIANYLTSHGIQR